MFKQNLFGTSYQTSTKPKARRILNQSVYAKNKSELIIGNIHTYLAYKNN